MLTKVEFNRSIATVCFQSTLFQAGRPVSKWVDRFQSRSVVANVTHVIRTCESSEEMHGNSPTYILLFFFEFTWDISH